MVEGVEKNPTFFEAKLPENGIATQSRHGQKKKKNFFGKNFGNENAMMTKSWTLLLQSNLLQVGFRRRESKLCCKQGLC